MSEPKTGLASLGLDNAIRLRWALRDIRGQRQKLSPVGPQEMICTTLIPTWVMSR